MRLENLHTRIFLDSGDPQETKDILSLLGFLDGQTTNPTLVSKNPFAKERFEKGEKFTKKELFGFYKKVVQEIAPMIPQGSVSVEVYADKDTKAEQMLEQGREMFSWIQNAHIKFPTTAEGLKAANAAVQEGMRVNMTLVFSQEQAAAVYAATMGATKGQVFVSPFIGRLDDRGENGMQLIENIIEMYKKGDGHVQVLTASVRNLNHYLQAIKLGSDIITSPSKILKEWGEKGLPMPGSDFVYKTESLSPIPYKELDLQAPVDSFDIHHELTDAGMERFSADWNSLIKHV